MIWLLRAKRWIKHPPSKQRLFFVVGVVAVCLVLVAIDRLGYWPEWATSDAELRRFPRVGF